MPRTRVRVVPVTPPLLVESLIVANWLEGGRRGGAQVVAEELHSVWQFFNLVANGWRGCEKKDWGDQLLVEVVAGVVLSEINETKPTIREIRSTCRVHLDVLTSWLEEKDTSYPSAMQDGLKHFLFTLNKLGERVRLIIT